MDSSMNGGSNQPQPGNRGGFRRRRRRRGGPKGQPGLGQSQGQGPNQGQNSGPGQQHQGRISNQPRHQHAGRHSRRNRNRRGSGAFVGPMDHSYRTGANGNINDNRGNMIHNNGRFRGQDSQNGGAQEPAFEPLPLREDAPTRIFCFVDDLFFFAKINEIARKLNIKVEFVKNEKEHVDRILNNEEKPSLIVFDLNNVNAKPLALIPKLRARLKRSTSIIGFLSHIQGDLKVKAQEAGCDMVMPRSAFSQNLPQILHRHAMVDEPDDNFGNQTEIPATDT